MSIRRFALRTAASTAVALVATTLAVGPAHSDQFGHDRPGNSGHGWDHADDDSWDDNWDDPRPSEVSVPTLVGRAKLSADFLAAGPPSGAKMTPANGRTGPFNGQVIPGFSAMLDNGDGTFMGLPDNGFGTKANSADFLLRMYRVAPNFTGEGGDGSVDVESFISFRDPKKLLDFPIVNGATRERLLTGADFDVESVVRLRDGSLLVGEEFGPFLLRFSPSGILLNKPVPLPGAQSPQNPYLGSATPTIGQSKGFEALAAWGRYAYPIFEGAALTDTDKRRRWIYQFDVNKMRYTGKKWAYHTIENANLVGDAFMTGPTTMLVLERDNFGGALAVTKRIVEVDLSATDPAGYVASTPVIDMLNIANPELVGTVEGEYGTADPFAFPFVSTETIVQLEDGSFILANDNNYPGDAARIPGTPDDTEIVHVESLTVPVEEHAHTVFAHRGSSAYRPEHTIAAYELAARQCADFIEPDLVMTKDGVLVDRHEPEISGTTNVAARPEFADRKTTKLVDGKPVTGWFTEDFTLAELKTLRAIERLPQVRPDNKAFDGKYEVPTFDEVLNFARKTTTCDGRQIGVIPEIKHSTYWETAGLKAEQPVLDRFAANGMDADNSRVIIQSFEVGNLKELSELTDFDLVQLIDCQGAPYDLVAAGDHTTYADLVSPEGMSDIATYASSVGYCKNVMIPRSPDGSLGEPTAAIDLAHEAGLTVTGWTFRAENAFLPLQFRSSTDPAAQGDLAGEIRAFLDAGMDDFFTDNPDIGAEVAYDEVGSE